MKLTSKRIIYNNLTTLVTSNHLVIKYNINSLYYYTSQQHAVSVVWYLE